MKKNGFIATSLIYSFFLVFIALIATLLNNYIANKTILERYNENAEENLNNDTFSVQFIAYGAEAYSEYNYSYRLTNLLQDGSLSTVNKTGSSWIKSGTISTSFYESSNPRYLNVSSATSNSHFYFEFPTVQDHKYYFAIKNWQNTDTAIEVSLPGSSISTSRTNSEWRKYSNIYSSPASENATRFIMGKSSISYSNVRFAEAIVIDLTAAYGLNNEPEKAWLDDNLEFFDGTVNYYVETDIERGKSLTIKLAGRNSINPSISCIGKNSNWVANSTTLVHDIKSTGLDDGTVKLEDITDDILCSVRWQNG